MSLPHQCDDDCVCPVHGTPLIYHPAGDDHACQDVNCEHGHGGLDPVQAAQVPLPPDGEFECPVPSAMDDWDRLQRRRGEGMYTPLRKMLVPDAVNFRTVSGDDSPSAFLAAVLETLSRDALHRSPPPLAGDCGHDLRALPIVEFRQTVLCAMCGGLAVEASAELTANPAAFTIGDDGRISRKG